MQGNSSLYTSQQKTPDSLFPGIYMGYWSSDLPSTVTNVNTTMTIAGNAYVEVGASGQGQFNLQANNQSVSLAYNVLNLKRRLHPPGPIH